MIVFDSNPCTVRDAPSLCHSSDVKYDSQRRKLALVQRCFKECFRWTKVWCVKLWTQVCLGMPVAWTSVIPILKYHCDGKIPHRFYRPLPSAEWAFVYENCWPVFVLHDFSSEQCQTRGTKVSYGAIWGFPLWWWFYWAARSCLLPWHCHVRFHPFLWEGARKIQGLMKDWTFRMGRICPHSLSRRALTRPDPAKSSRTWSADMLRLWWRNALINFMLCVDFLCMDARIVACQRVVSHASWAESHGHSLQGRSRRGVSCPRSAGPALLRYDQLEQQETWTLKHHGNITAPPRGCDILGKLRR